MSVYIKQLHVLQITFVADDSAETVVVSAVQYSRTGVTGPFLPIGFVQTAGNLSPNDLLVDQGTIQAVDVVRLTFTVVP